MKKLAIATAILLATPAASRAAVYFDTGNQYWERCSGNGEPGLEVTCGASAAAFLDMMQSLEYQCSSTGVTRTQAKDVLLKWLADNPEDRRVPAATLAAAAFIKAFGCKKPEGGSK
jgi:hypothetical protein